MARIVGIAAFAMASLVSVGTAQTTALGTCETWECGGAGYVNTLEECLTPEQARRRLACEELPTDDDHWTDGEYLVDDDDYISSTTTDTPVCSQELCCEPSPTPQPAMGPTPTPTPTAEPVSASTCLNGFEGIDGFGSYCCPIGCNQCGGNGCGTAGAENGLSGDECCGGGVKRSGIYCDDVEAPPCVYGASPSPTPTPEPPPTPTPEPPSPTPAFESTCLNGFEGIDGFGSYCCPIGCNQCGGNGCGTAGAENGLSGDECCGGGVKRAGIYCDDVEAPPCVYGASPSPQPSPTPEPPSPSPEPEISTCLNGLEGLDGFGVYCCPIGCNQCGGGGCGTASLENGLSGTECCGGGIKRAGVYCDDSGAAPCLY